MVKKAIAIAHGAATIVNAIALGKGAAFGVDLWTKAEVELTSEVGVFQTQITSDPCESTLLVEKTVAHILQKFDATKSFGAKIKTESNIPTARGLKSSSAAANATALATAATLGETLNDLDLIKVGVEAALDAKCTITGAFDDACASFFGGAILTDNSKMQILKQLPLPEDLVVLFLVPQQKAYTINSDVKRLQKVKPLVEIAFQRATDGKLWEALTLNGLIYSAASNQNPSIAIDALAAGAVAAGLCGKGPTVTAVCPIDKVRSVKVALQKYEGDVQLSHFNSQKARVL